MRMVDFFCGAALTFTFSAYAVEWIPREVALVRHHRGDRRR